MFGAIYGDVIGSYYEVHCTKDYNFEFNKDSSFTDDSVLIAAVCKAILNNPSEVSKWTLRARSKNTPRNTVNIIHITHMPDLEICLSLGRRIRMQEPDTVMQMAHRCVLSQSDMHMIH